MGGGVDLGFFGKRYTWENGLDVMALINERLDQAVENHLWILSFLKATVEHFAMDV